MRGWSARVAFRIIILSARCTIVASPPRPLGAAAEQMIEYHVVCSLHEFGIDAHKSRAGPAPASPVSEVLRRSGGGWAGPLPLTRCGNLAGVNGRGTLCLDRNETGAN